MAKSGRSARKLSQHARKRRVKKAAFRRGKSIPALREHHDLRELRRTLGLAVAAIEQVPKDGSEDERTAQVYELKVVLRASISAIDQFISSESKEISFLTASGPEGDPFPPRKPSAKPKTAKVIEDPSVATVTKSESSGE